MFKTTLTAAAFALIAMASHAAPAPVEATILRDIVQVEELAYYCEWAYVYDAYGNWVTAWQCY